MKLISIMIPCYNEESNIQEMYHRVTKVFQELPQYEYELMITDNCSTDHTPELLRKIAAKDKHVKIILNARNFGVERSCTNAFLGCMGDAVIQIAADLQDPPEMINEFIHYWEKGYKIVLGQKQSTKDIWLIGICRKLYYTLMAHLSDDIHLKDVTGFGLYDKTVMDILRWTEDPSPYTRGILCDWGRHIKLIPYNKQKRHGGRSSYNFGSYLSMAIWGIVSTSKKPLRYIFYLSGLLMLCSIITVITSYITKYTFQDNLGIIIGILFAMTSLITLSIGIVGEYVGLILTKVTKRPLTISQEKINFDESEFSPNIWGH